MADFDTSELEDLQRTMRRWSFDVPPAVEDGAVDSAVRVARDAEALKRSRPGGGSYARGLAGYDGRRTSGGGLIAIRGATGRAAEWGTRRAWVFGRVLRASALSRRVFPRWVPTSSATSGYVVGEALKRAEDRIVGETLEAADAAMRGSARRDGIRTRGRMRGGL